MRKLHYFYLFLNPVRNRIANKLYKYLSLAYSINNACHSLVSAILSFFAAAKLPCTIQEITTIVDLL